MRSVFIIFTIFFGFSLIYAQNCDDKKKVYEQKLDEWKEIEIQMKSEEITKKKYEELLPKYNSLWEESQNLKKEYLKCKDESLNLHKKSYNEGIAFKKEKKYNKALEKFLETIKIKPDFEEAYEQAALVSIELGNFLDMEKYVIKVSDKTKKGKIYHKAGNELLHTDPDIAISYFKEMGKNYKPETANYLIGGIYISIKNDPGSAITYYKKALEIDPKSHKIYNALGGSLVELSNKTKNKQKKDKIMDEAASVFLKGIQLGKKRYRKYYELCVRLAQLYNHRGKAISALNYADKSIKYSKDKNYSMGHLERAIALIKMEKWNDAKKSLNIAKEDFLAKKSAEFYLAEIERLKKK